MSFILSRTEQSVATITLNRPDKLNALVGTMRQELHDAISRAAADRQVRAIVITGAGRGFCAGGDVESMSGLQERGADEEFLELLEAGRRVVTAIREAPKPVLAAVNGVAAGAGCNLALACDCRIAALSATIGPTFVRIGLHPDWGGTFFLPRLVGTSRALEMMMSGRMVDASEALAIGLVDRVVELERLPDEAQQLAESFAAGPPIPIRDLKRAVYASETNALATQIALESENQLRAFRSRDAREGMRAFFEKRKPEFRGE